MSKSASLSEYIIILLMFHAEKPCFLTSLCFWTSKLSRHGHAIQPRVAIWRLLTAWPYRVVFLMPLAPLKGLPQERVFTCVLTVFMCFFTLLFLLVRCMMQVTICHVNLKLSKPYKEANVWAPVLRTSSWIFQTCYFGISKTMTHLSAA